ncbi:MAG: tetratricopeptide repeat protein [Deltaproteobacteria bacterium]
MSDSSGDTALSQSYGHRDSMTPQLFQRQTERIVSGTRLPAAAHPSPARYGSLSSKGDGRAFSQVIPRFQPRHLPLPRSGLFGVLLIGALGIALVAGCSRKVVRHTSVFDLGKVFSGQSLDHQQQDDRTWKEKGLTLVDERDFDNAIQAFTRYVEEEPEEFFGFNAIGICYKNSGDYPQAMKNFERALELAQSDEDRAKILSNIGNLYFATNRPQAALGYYKEAASRFAKNPLYLILIGRTFILLDEPERAQKVLAQAESMQGNLKKYERREDRGLGHYLMANCYAALGDEDRVLKYLGQALKANPEKYVTRLKKDLRDEKNLFFTMKEDPELKTLIRKYRARLSPAFWLEDS